MAQPHDRALRWFRAVPELGSSAGGAGQALHCCGHAAIAAQPCSLGLGLHEQAAVVGVWGTVLGAEQLMCAFRVVCPAD